MVAQGVEHALHVWVVCAEQDFLDEFLNDGVFCAQVCDVFGCWVGYDLVGGAPEVEYKLLVL